MHFAHKYRSLPCTLTRRRKFLFLMLFIIMSSLTILVCSILHTSRSMLRGHRLAIEDLQAGAVPAVPATATPFPFSADTEDITENKRPLPAATPWVSGVDSTTGQTYWYNHDTKQSQWANPFPPPLPRTPPKTKSELLSWFADLLEKDKIAYFVAFGTLLGAIRNQRIIPWTCDVDIVIPDLRTAKVQQFFEDLACDNTNTKSSKDCDKYFLLGKPNTFVFHLHVNPKIVTMETCTATGSNFFAKAFGSGEPCYLDIYSTLTQGSTDESKKDWPTKYRRTNPNTYFVGSKWSGKMTGHFMLHDEIYPLNLTGSKVNGRFYPTPKSKEIQLNDVFGKNWRVPDNSWEGAWSLLGWTWSKNGIYRVGG